MGHNVWIVNQYAGSPTHGMEYRHHLLGLELAKAGLDVTVISATFSHLFQRLPTTRRASVTQTVDGLRFRWLWVPSYRSPYGIGRLFNMIVFAVQLLRLPRDLPRPTSIVASSPSPFIFPVAWLLARRHGARFIIEVRDLWPLTLQELAGLPGWHPLVLLMRWCESFAYRTCDVAVSVLSDAEPHMRARGLAPGKFRYIPNGINVAVDQPEPSAAPGGRKREGTHTVGYVGTLSAANAVGALIGAARDLAADPNIRFVICGKGPAGDELRARARGLSNVAFVGPIPRGDVPALLATVDSCYVGFRRSPLYRFGISPNKLYDCMVAGKPVLLAAEVPSSEVERAGCGVVIAPEDPDALAAAIRELAGMDPERLAEMGQRGRSYVTQHHTYAALASSYLKVL